ncbi:uncharacterized protein LACBIDRAFT_307564 [Laccaria bicolor S238N-H82]|uniref:Predicted protein n=1 Tax=Laccaria bicolor (strain S238N-H82 / ATCC MYA-4686) TaxID=486041 RepID=B0DQF6_LACBS|nr:uncharacterized protein LACBIDRAFT_307564 [Laccaria bicolor S238N-H82]EDR03101.1 predicted protein [Laccaria bicolor S238N-H82]|eukprot:XP_001886242.1 predicted protein [Laccaria bicolor S238N-H82]
MTSGSHQALHIQSPENEVDAGNVVYRMHPIRSDAIRRWASNVDRERNTSSCVSNVNCGVTCTDVNPGTPHMSIEEPSTPNEIEAMTICSSEDAEDIQDRLNRTSHLNNLANSNIYSPGPPHVHPSASPNIHTPESQYLCRPHPPVRPKVTRKISMFSGASNITLSGGTFTNCGGSVNVTYTSNGGRTIKNIDSFGNVNVTRIVNSGTVVNPERGGNHENKTHIVLESNVFSGIKDAVFTGGNFTHSPQFNVVQYGQSSPDTINARPNGLPPRHLRGRSPPPPPYSARE